MQGLLGCGVPGQNGETRFLQRFDSACNIPGVLVPAAPCPPLQPACSPLRRPRRTSLERTTAACHQQLGPDYAGSIVTGLMDQASSLVVPGQYRQSGGTRPSGTGGLVIPDDVVVHRHGCNGSGLRFDSTCGLTELIPSDPNTCGNSWTEPALWTQV